MKGARRRAISGLLLAAAAAATAGPVRAASAVGPKKPLPAPPAGSWRFGLHFGGVERGLKVALVTYTIELDGGRYRMSADGRAEGLAALVYSGVLSQKSEGRLTAAGLVPERYWERRGKRPERTVEIDRDKREVRFSDRPKVAYVDGLQDRLSLLLQLGLMARASPKDFSAGSEIALPELGSSRVLPSVYASRGEVELARAAGGTRRALHLERVAPRDADDARIDIWLGYDLDLLPVRIRFTDSDGQVLDQLLED